MNPPDTRWRYRLHVDINPTDAAVLRDAIDGEPFGLVKRLGLDEVRRMIDAFAIEVDAESNERWLELDNDVAILSLYLSQEQVTASEIQVAPMLRAWRIVGRRGQTVRLDLEVARDEKDGAIVLGEEDVEALEARWATLPEWARASLRHKFPDLTAISEPRPGS